MTPTTRSVLLVSMALSATLLSPAPAAAQTPTPLQTQLFGTFNAPVHLLSPPGDIERIFVVEKTGRIRLHKNGAVLATPFLDISSQVLVGYEQGMLGMAFHPDYLTNGWFYVNYTQAGSGATVIARYRIQGGTNFDRADPASALVILTFPQPYANHNGGTLRFGRDRMLYIGTGDGGLSNDPQNRAQDPTTLYGKLLRIDVDNPSGGRNYGIPAGNPYAGSTAGAQEILMLGLRNPWKFSFDRLTGDLYIGDVGQDTLEEVDFVPAAHLQSPITPSTMKNFGWRCMEGTWCTGLGGCTCNASNLTMPIHTYQTVPSYAIIGGYVYRGCGIPDLRGTYFFGDFGSGRIWSMRVVGGVPTQFTNRTTELDPAGSATITGISSFGEDACGELYVLEHAGDIWKIVAAPPGANQGLVPFGTGTAGCSGAHTLTANCAAVLLNPTWRLESTNAPPSSVGLAVLGLLPDTTGSDPFGIGTLLHVQLTAPHVTWAAFSDGTGFGTAPLRIANDPALVGWQMHAQILWLWPGSSCAILPYGVSSTPGLTVTFYP